MLSTCVVSPLLLEEAVEVEVAGDVDKVHEEQEDLHPGHHGDQRGRPLQQDHMETISECSRLLLTSDQGSMQAIFERAVDTGSDYCLDAKRFSFTMGNGCVLPFLM